MTEKSKIGSNQILDIFIGTKAQYIKTAPLLRLLYNRGLKYHLIDSGQHADFSRELREELKVKEPEVKLRKGGDIKTIAQAAAWFLRWTFITIFSPGTLRNHIFSRDSIYCVIHGDTPTTLLSLFMAKRAGKKVAHLEAGLRSFNLLRPFPEEIIRIICMRYSDVLFAPSEWSVNNLTSMGVHGDIINIRQNTNVEAVYYSLEKTREEQFYDKEFCLITLHRVETIFKKEKLIFILDILKNISETLNIIFVLHKPTKKKLDDFGLMSELQSIKNITIKSLVSHQEFLVMLSSCEFVITDGGSIQEEAFYLDVPCLIMRSETERKEGLDCNVRLSNFNKDQIMDFCDNYTTLKSGNRIENETPSRRILEYFYEPLD